MLQGRARAVSALLAVGSLASVVGLPAVAVLADWGGWRFAFIVAGLLSASGPAANWLWLPRDRGERVLDLVIFSRPWSPPAPSIRERQSPSGSA